MQNCDKSNGGKVNQPQLSNLSLINELHSKPENIADCQSFITSKCQKYLIPWVTN